MVDLLTYDEDTKFILMDDAATVSAIVRRIPIERLRGAKFGEWTTLDVLGHLTDVSEVFAERVRRAIQEDAPRLEPIPEGMAGDPHRDPMDLTRRFLKAHQRIVALLQDPGAVDRPAIHGEWGRVNAGHLAAYEAQHSHEHVLEVSRAFPPSQ